MLGYQLATPEAHRAENFAEGASGVLSLAMRLAPDAALIDRSAFIPDFANGH